MNKNELEWKRAVLRSENLSGVFGIVKHAITATAVAGCIYIIFHSLELIVQARPDSLIALGGFVEKLNLGSTLSYIAAALSSAGWYYERLGKKRAIRKLKDFRTTAEQGDKYNESSGLDDDGHTPN